jgi:hypothetical protein
LLLALARARAKNSTARAGVEHAGNYAPMLAEQLSQYDVSDVMRCRLLDNRHITSFVAIAAAVT